MYDTSQPASLLSLGVALTLLPEAGMYVDKEIFVSLLEQWRYVFACLCRPDVTSVGVVVQTPITVAVSGRADTIVVFDSHSHGDKGAAVTMVKSVSAAAFLRELFPGSIAHFGLLLPRSTST